MTFWVTVIGLVSIAAAVIAAVVAAYKKRSADGWAFASFLFAPALIILLLLPSNKTPMDATAREAKKLRDILEDGHS